MIVRRTIRQLGQMSVQLHGTSCAPAKATLMHHPDPTLPYHVYFDASIRGIGGMLGQDRERVMHPAAFCARRLQPAETRYSTTEQELLAIVYSFTTWRCYLEGAVVFAHTDHEPPTWLARKKSMNRRQAHWMEFFGRFDYTLLYIKGDLNVVADALSRQLAFSDVAPMPLPGEFWPHSPEQAMLTSLCCARRFEQRFGTEVRHVSKVFPFQSSGRCVFAASRPLRALSCGGAAPSIFPDSVVSRSVRVPVTPDNWERLSVSPGCFRVGVVLASSRCRRGVFIGGHTRRCAALDSGGEERRPAEGAGQSGEQPSLPSKRRRLDSSDMPRDTQVELDAAVRGYRAIGPSGAIGP